MKSNFTWRSFALSSEREDFRPEIKTKRRETREKKNGKKKRKEKQKIKKKSETSVNKRKKKTKVRIVENGLQRPRSGETAKLSIGIIVLSTANFAIPVFLEIDSDSTRPMKISN